MLANASHSPVWTCQAYVCLACRRQQLRLPRQQRRWITQVHPTSTSTSSDSWFDTLNDISDNFSTHTPAKPKPKSKPKPEPAPNVSKKVEAKERKDAFDELRNSLPRKVESPRATHPPTSPKVFRTVKVFKETIKSAKVKPSTHKAKRQRRRASSDIAQDVHASGSAAEGIAEPKGMISMGALIEQLKEVQHEKAAEDDERISWTKEAQDCLEQGQPEDGIKDDVVVKADRPDESGPRPFPAFNVGKGQVIYRPIAAVGDITIPQDTTSKTRKQSKDAVTDEKSASGIDQYKAKTSPSASGLGGRLEESEREPMSLTARWKKQQMQSSPYGVQRQLPAPITPVVSFDSLRDADKVSDETTIASKPPTPFGLGFAPWRSHPFEKAEVEASWKDDAQSAVMGKEGAPSKGKLIDMDSLLASFQARLKVEEIMNVVEEETRPVSEAERQSESATEDAADPDNVRAHESLAGLYRGRYCPRKDSPTRNLSRKSITPLSERQAEEAEHTTPALAVQKSSGESPMPAGQSIADAMKAGRGARQDSGNAPPQSPPFDAQPPDELQASSEQIMSLNPSDIEVKPLDIPQPHVPYLEYGLDRVLFNPGVYQLQDPASRVYNFDPYLQDIMPVTDFDFNALKEYKTSSQDEALSALAIKEGKRYIGSTSSMTSSLAHFHYLLSNFRPINTNMYSREFSNRDPKNTFTEINRAPSAMFLRWKNGAYAIDADKEYDGGNVLMLLGKSLELLLTLPKDEYERYRKSDPRQVSEAQRTSPESYQYTTMRDFLMRSQLDAYDPRLPGNGTFDLKTRAVVAIRMSASDYQSMTGYELFNLQGKWGSYEKEYYDMTRSTMLKYMLQARMGRMNGIFVAYHNVKRIFGFQYIPMHEMDRALHGQTDTCLGDQEFKASLDIMNEVLNKATAKFPNQSLRFHFETRPGHDDVPTTLHVFAEPMTEKAIDTIQNAQKAKIAAFERDIMGVEDRPAVDEDNENRSLGLGSGNAVEAESSTLTNDDDGTNEANNDDAVVETETPIISSTAASADREFLNSIGTSNDSLKPLFHATVIVQSKVDGEYIDADRPTDLKKNQKWEIDYILTEYEITRHHWALYEDCKARRRHALYDGSDDDAADVDAESDRSLHGYLQFLRQMSQKGAKIRSKVDKMDAGRKVVTVETPLNKERERIESLEDYMEWMYRGKDV